MLSDEAACAKGRLVLVVGPSGAGKDTILRSARLALAGEPRYEFPRRWVTRQPDGHEDSLQITPEYFRDGRARGLFALSWEAHGNGYAVDRQIEALLEQDRTVVCNVSRTVVEEARRRYPNVLIIEITAHPEVLVERLRHRQRETPADQVRRLERANSRETAITADVIIDNSDGLEEGVAAFLQALAAT